MPVDDPHADALRHLSEVDARLGALVERFGPFRLGKLGAPSPSGSDPSRANDHFEGLVEAIVSQQLSAKAASTIFARVRALGLDAEGRFDPAILLARPGVEVRSAGLSGQKMAYVRDLCERVLRGAIDFVALEAKSDAEVIEALCTIKGVGRWTAEMFLIFRLGRMDVLPVGDLGVQKGFQKLFRLRAPPTAERMVKLAKPFRPYRSALCWYLWRLNEEKTPPRPRAEKR